MTYKNNILSVILILFLLSCILASIKVFNWPPIFNSKAYDTPVIFKLTVDNAVLKKDQVVNINVDLDPVSMPVSSIELDVQYNPKSLIISPDTVELGFLLPTQLGQITISNVNSTTSILKVNMIANCTSNGCAPVKTTGSVAKLAFTTLDATASTQVSVSTETKVYLATNTSASVTSYPYTSNTLVLNTTVTPTPTSTQTPTPTPSTTVVPTPVVSGNTTLVKPSADTYVKEKYSSSNYSKENSLTASNYDSDNTQYAFVKFDLSNLKGTIKKAQLRLVPSLERTVQKSVKIVSNSDWSESSLTWSNKPSAGTKVGNFSAKVTPDNPITIDLTTSVINSFIGKNLTLRIGDSSDDKNTLTFNSREVSGKEPVLLLDVDQSESSPSIVTATVKDDSYVQSLSDRADNSYGDKDNLVTSSFESTNQEMTYIKFGNSALAGKNVKSAKLYLTVALERKVQKEVRFVANNEWKEDSLTYNNKPTLGGKIGSIDSNDSAFNLGQTLEVDLDPSTLILSSSGEVSIAIANLSSENTLSVYSKEYSESSKRPKLVLEVY